MLIDLNVRELNFFSGEEEAWKLWHCHFCDQCDMFWRCEPRMSTVSVDMSGLKLISQKVLKVFGDSVWYWVPINSGSNIKHIWDSIQNGGDLNPNKTTVTKNTQGINYHEMRFGKYYVEVSVESRGKSSLGFTNKKSLTSGIEDNDKTVIYYSTGDIGTTI